VRAGLLLPRAKPIFCGVAPLSTARLLPMEFAPAPVSPTVIRAWDMGIRQIRTTHSFPRVGIVVWALKAMRSERIFRVSEDVNPLFQAAAQATSSNFLVFMGARGARKDGIGYPVGTGHIEFSPWRTNASSRPSLGTAPIIAKTPNGHFASQDFRPDAWQFFQPVGTQADGVPEPSGVRHRNQVEPRNRFHWSPHSGRSLSCRFLGLRQVEAILRGRAFTCSRRCRVILDRSSLRPPSPRLQIDFPEI